MKCNNCGFENRGTSKFCIKCGQPILQQQLVENNSELQQSYQQKQGKVQTNENFTTKNSTVQIQHTSTPVVERMVQTQHTSAPVEASTSLLQQTIVFSRKTVKQSSPNIQINNIANRQNVAASNIPASNIPASNIPASKTVCASRDNHIKDNGGKKKVVAVSVSIAAIIASVATLEAILLLCIF